MVTGHENISEIRYYHSPKIDKGIPCGHAYVLDNSSLAVTAARGFNW